MSALSSLLRSTVPHTRLRAVLAALAVLAVVVAVVGLVAHFRAASQTWALGVTAFSPYLMLGSVAALVLLLIARLWLPAVVTLALVVVCAATQLHLYTTTSPPRDAVSVTVMTSNLRLGSADPRAVVSAVRRHHVDLLMLEELTVAEQHRLEAAGLDSLLAHHVSDPSDYAVGTGLWSRYPLTDTVRRHDFALNFVTGVVRIPHVDRPVQLGAAHMAGPYPDSHDWLLDIAHLPAVLRTLGQRGTALVGGDFNSTPDTHQFRAALVDGWSDGADQAGAGYTRTYPSDRAFPPLIAIDHVLTHDAVATSAQTVEIPGSDHRALIVRVAIARS